MKPLYLLESELAEKKKLHKEYDTSIKDHVNHLSPRTITNFRIARAKIKKEMNELKALIETHPDYVKTKI